MRKRTWITGTSPGDDDFSGEAKLRRIARARRHSLNITAPAIDRQNTRWSCGRSSPCSIRASPRSCGALLIGSAHLEAAGVQQVGGGGEHVRHAVAQIDMAVAVEADAILDVGRRQELRLA